jgi:tRNA modification GTPase
MIEDTICAIATPHGVGGISIVRLSGPLSLEIARKIAPTMKVTPRNAQLCTLYDRENALIDEAIVIYFQAPRSYTGEDVVELQSHGGTITADRIITTALAYGARIANPGEFTKRAVIHGKMDLAQAEAVAKLIESKSVDAAKILSKQLKGELKRYVEDLRNRLVEILAFVEVNIDYAEEDLPATLQEQISRKLNEIAKILTKTLHASRSREGLLEGFKVAIVGKPNVGKSSLLNALLHYERAIISDIAGTTRDTIEEEIRIGTHLVRIVDTAGIRESVDTIEQIGIERSLNAIESADIVIALFDASGKLDKNDEEIISLIARFQTKKEIVVVLNKSDLPQKIEKERLQSFDPITLSTKEDLTALIKRLSEILDKQSCEDETVLISKRQVGAAQNAYDAIVRSKELLKEGSLELFAYEINEAIEAIASITDAFERDEILDQMFGNFCLGK